MTVENKGDEFPVGMRVLAVDDDPVCLKVLEALLLRCQYNVTTTHQAVLALEMLREKKDKFDLVISDVHMPDMDGFKLLELVGLEMDLPVIMLSGNGETRAVMKGILHGACDYLLKPVRIEQLQNIWQHVVRKQKTKKKYTDINGDKENSQELSGPTGAQEKTDCDKKINKRRKDQISDSEDVSDDTLQENANHSTTKKKPRVVWSVELHRRFVSAVEQLGIEKAVPKKILDLMNAENLTRENVASHLQKYRLFLKRLSDMSGQPSSMATTFGGGSSPFAQMSNLNGYPNHALRQTKHFPTLSAYQPAGFLNRIATTATVGRHGYLPSQTFQVGGAYRHTGSYFSDQRKLQNLSVPATDRPAMLPGMPTSLHSSQATRGPFHTDLSATRPAVSRFQFPQIQKQSVSYGGWGNSYSVTDKSLFDIDELHRCSDLWDNSNDVVASNNFADSSLSAMTSFSSNEVQGNNSMAIVPMSNGTEGEAHCFSVDTNVPSDIDGTLNALSKAMMSSSPSSFQGDHHTLKCDGRICGEGMDTDGTSPSVFDNTVSPCGGTVNEVDNGARLLHTDDYEMDNASFQRSNSDTYTVDDLLRVYDDARRIL